MTWNDRLEAAWRGGTVLAQASWYFVFNDQMVMKLVIKTRHSCDDGRRGRRWCVRRRRDLYSLAHERAVAQPAAGGGRAIAGKFERTHRDDLLRRRHGMTAAAVAVADRRPPFLSMAAGDADREIVTMTNHLLTRA